MIISISLATPSIQVKEAVTPEASDKQPDLGSLAQQARWRVIKAVTSSKAGHIGGPLSMMDFAGMSLLRRAQHPA
jgi:transketolase N-terminal domain/subunit